MALQIDTVTHACKMISREIKDYQKNLTVHFIVHHKGQRAEALALAAQDILSHPASKTAMSFLQKQKRSEDSMVLGTAIARQNLFFGLVTRDSVIMLCAINIDQFDNLKEAKHQAYHLAWHGFDTIEYNKIKNIKGAITRKRTGLETSYANLQADIFSASMSALHHDESAYRSIAKKRGQDILRATPLQSPEFYPFVIATEATEFALKQIKPKEISKKKIVSTALKIAKQVRQTFKETSLKHWLSFAEQAQKMAWQNYNEENILSAAINTSPNTYIRITGYLISEITEIAPASILDSRENYSAFTDNKSNKKLHKNTIDNIYQNVIAQATEQNSGLPFLKLANQQNTELTNGHILGWCAPALHAAGTAYEKAKERGMKPEQDTIEKFKSKKDSVKWQDLKQLGIHITKNRRLGHNIELGDLIKITHNNDIKGLEKLEESINNTMRDPQYQHKLAATEEIKHDAPLKARALV